MLDLKRRGFLFGAAALAAVPPARKYFIMPRRRVLTLDPVGSYWTGFGPGEPMTVSFDMAYHVMDMPSVGDSLNTFRIEPYGDREFALVAKEWSSRELHLATYTAMEVRRTEGD